MTNIKILNEFSKGLFLLNYSKVTIKEYICDLTLFFNFIIKYLDWGIDVKDVNVFLLATINKASIIAFIEYLILERDNKECAICRKITSLKTFYKWLYAKYKNTVLSDQNNILEEFEYVTKKKQRLPRYLQLQEALKIENIYTKQNSKNSLRNNTIIKIFLQQGLRLNELANINIEDLDFKNKEFKVIGKGNKTRTIYLNNSIIDQLKSYIADRESGPLFLNNRGERLSKRSIQFICEKAYFLAGIENCTTHTLRHTFATHIYMKTKDILSVKEALGHDSVVSTEIYTHVDNEELREAVNRNPLNIA